MGIVIYTFLIIGLFTFGGGYSMVALIQDEVVVKHHWLTAQEFTDMLALSQMTPGPIGINTATYAGYSATLSEGYPQGVAVIGAVAASLAVIIGPMLLMLAVCHFMRTHKGNPTLEGVMKVVRMAVIGLIAAAALSMVGAESFGTAGISRQFITSLLLFCAVFYLSYKKKASPIMLIVGSGLTGLLVYSL